MIYVPSGYEPARPTPLVLLFHGAGGNARGGIDPLLQFADQAGLILLAPDSRGRTWDIILGNFGADVEFVDRALEHAFDRYRVDGRRIAIGGFSDGASYALSLGLTNGDLFSYVMAFSPGFSLPGRAEGSPAVFISHGADDRVLPINRTSRQVVPALRRRGYQVEYEEFAGGHTVPPRLVSAALEAFLGG